MDSICIDLAFRYLNILYHPQDLLRLQPPFSLNHSSQIKRARSANAHNRPSRPDNRLISDLSASIPNQMPDAIKTVEGKRHRNGKFRSNLQSYRPSGERRSQAG
jgi:hypothetical protein